MSNVSLHVYFRMPGETRHWLCWIAVDEQDRCRVVLALLAAGYIVQN